MMNTVIDVKALNTQLEFLFGIDVVSSFVEVQKGLLCRNFSFEHAERKYFLKLYTRSTGETIKQIKAAEVYFSDRGIPIVLPVMTRQGEYAFMFEGKWFSLFPFVDTSTPSAKDLNGLTIMSLGKMLAKLHRAGKEADLEKFDPFRFWNVDQFLSDAKKIEELVLKEGISNEAERLAFANIKLQKEYLEQTKKKSPEEFNLSFDCLLHGDFIYTNTFVDEKGEVLMTYDLEKTGVGPRAYDLARSVFISCFDDGWKEKNYEFARMFLQSYNKEYPISNEELEAGIRMYVTHFMHMSWLESKIILDKSKPHYQLMRPAYERMTHFRVDLDLILKEFYLKQ